MATTAETTSQTGAAKRSTAASKAAQTRARNRAATARQRSAAARKAAETRRELAKTPVDRVAEYAEKAVLVPVGAALIARDSVVSTVQDLRATYSTQARAEAQLRRFERRGTTARNSLEREVRRTRTRLERELRQRRTRAQRLVNRNRTRIERELRQRTREFDLAQARVENALQTGLTGITQLSTEIQKRIASVA